MNEEDINVGSWTFDQGQKATAPDFSIVVPDGWEVFGPKEEGDRAFRVYPGGTTWEDVEEHGEYGIDGFIYCAMPNRASDEVRAALQDRGIDEFVRALVRVVRDSDSNPMAASMRRTEFVKGRNCYVLVSLADKTVGYSADIVPCMPFSNDLVRLFCPFQSSEHADAAFAKVCEMAQTVELAEPLTCDIMAALQKCKSEVVDPDFFVDMVERFGGALNQARDIERGPAGERFIRETRRAIEKGEITDGKDIPTVAEHTIEFMSDFSNRTTYYAFDLLDAYTFQKEHGAQGDDAQRMIEAIGEFMVVYEPFLSSDDPEEKAKIDELGNIRRPDDYEKLRDLIEAEYPGYKAKHDAEMEANYKADESAADAEADARAVGQEGVSANGGPAATSESYEAWWEPFPEGREPYYAGYNLKFDHAAACWLLYEDRLFFNDDEIVWDGHHHSIVGAQINAACMAEIPVFMERADNYAPGFTELMTEIEKDEGLIIPREMIHPVTQNALREGDLTGITLMNLQACAKAVMIKQAGPHQYNVLSDPRVTAGIPDFLNLIARLIWDMREYNGVEEPFSVAVFGARNLDANVFFGENGFLDDEVPGAATELSGTFKEKPTVTLPSAEAIEAANEPFASGFDYPNETQADEGLFDSAIESILRCLPNTVSIEGTGYLGRAARIEDVKVGDELVLAADWQSEYFDPCCIEVFNAKGETLGNLSPSLSFAGSGHRELALLLPYITATVESVTPVSKRRKNAKYALMDVRMEVDEDMQLGLFDHIDSQVLRRAKSMLRLPAPQRITMSKSSLSFADLKGNIDTSAMESPAAKEAAAPRDQQETQGNDGGAERASEEQAPAASQPVKKVQESPEQRQARIKLMIIDATRDAKKLKDEIIDKVLEDESNGEYEEPLRKDEIEKCFEQLVSDDKLSVTWGRLFTNRYMSRGMVHDRYRWHLEHVGEIPEDVLAMNGYERAKLAHEQAVFQFNSIKRNVGDGKFIISDSGWESALVDCVFNEGGGVLRTALQACADKKLRMLNGGHDHANIGIALDGLLSRKILMKKGDKHYLWTQRDVDGNPFEDPISQLEAIDSLRKKERSLKAAIDGLDQLVGKVANQADVVAKLEEQASSFGFFSGGAEKKRVKAELKEERERLNRLKKKLSDAESAGDEMKRCTEAIAKKMHAFETDKDRYRWY